MTRDPGWSNSWWGRDPIEEAELEERGEEIQDFFARMEQKINEARAARMRQEMARSVNEIRNEVMLMRIFDQARKH